MYIRDKLHALSELKNSYGDMLLSKALSTIAAKVTVCPTCKGEGKLISTEPKDGYMVTMCEICRAEGYILKEN